MELNVKIIVLGDVKPFISQQVSSFWRTLLSAYSVWLMDGGIIKIAWEE
jgi:hypothetical protein